MKKSLGSSKSTYISYGSGSSVHLCAHLASFPATPCFLAYFLELLKYTLRVPSAVDPTGIILFCFPGQALLPSKFCLLSLHDCLFLIAFPSPRRCPGSFMMKDHAYMSMYYITKNSSMSSPWEIVNTCLCGWWRKLVSYCGPQGRKQGSGTGSPGRMLLWSCS